MLSHDPELCNFEGISKEACIFPPNSKNFLFAKKTRSESEDLCSPNHELLLNVKSPNFKGQKIPSDYKQMGS